MLNTGSCGLHIIHNAFRSGGMEGNWEVGQTLSSFYWLFSPATVGVKTLFQLLDQLSSRNNFAYIGGGKCCCKLLKGLWRCGQM